jgi:hypothetical protein
MGSLKDAKEKGLKINHHGTLRFLLSDIDNNIVDAGYEDGVFWYAKINRGD